MISGRRRAQHLHIRQPELEFLAKLCQLPPLPHNSLKVLHRITVSKNAVAISESAVALSM